MDTYHRWMEVVVPATMSACPVLNVPAGFSPEGLPMGLQLWGPMRSEFRLLQIARAYEEATGWTERVSPPMLTPNEGQR
jgi:amidase